MEPEGQAGTSSFQEGQGGDTRPGAELATTQASRKESVQMSMNF